MFEALGFMHSLEVGCGPLKGEHKTKCLKTCACTCAHPLRYACPTRTTSPTPLCVAAAWLACAAAVPWTCVSKCRGASAVANSWSLQTGRKPVLATACSLLPAPQSNLIPVYYLSPQDRQGVIRGNQGGIQCSRSEWCRVGAAWRWDDMSCACINCALCCGCGGSATRGHPCGPRCGQGSGDSPLMYVLSDPGGAAA